MKVNLFLFIFFLSLSYSGLATPVDVIFEGRAGTALNSLRVYSDSTFTKPTSASFSAGSLLEILGETQLEHEDDAQNQTFKWYRVKSVDGKEGWVFGDGLAVIIPKDQLDEVFGQFYKKKMQFSSGFEDAVIWMAAIQGHDNFHANAFLNPLYLEGYIVITNHRGKSVHIHYGGESTQGVSRIKEIQFTELTGDKTAELILLRANESGRDKGITHSLELYSFQSGTIRKIFEERLNLPKQGKEKFLSTNKFLELDQQTIRVEYLEGKSCEDYSLPLRTGIVGASTSSCLEYVTYTYYWDSRQKKYQILYKESRSAPQVRMKNPGVFLQQSTTPGSARIRSIHPDEYLDVIRQQDYWTTERGRQIKESYFYVRLKDGQYGYIPIRYANFSNTSIATQIEQFSSGSSAYNSNDISYFHVRNTKVDSSAYHK